jgi:hypothetical protein
MKKILIPSKGRYGKSNLLTEINDKMANAAVFVEPQDFENYRLCYPNIEIVNIGDNNRGLPYSRNKISKYATENNLDWYWLLDDDVTIYKVEESGKQIKGGISYLNDAENLIINNENIAQGSLEYKQYAWSSPKKISFDGYCHCAVLINVALCKDIFCDENLQLKIDQDFSIQILKKGFSNMRISCYAVGSPKNGSNVGGLKSVYYKEEENCYKMIEKWGEVICQKIIKNDGRHDIKINWGKIKSNQIELF